MNKHTFFIILLFSTLYANAQQPLSLQECRSRAIENSDELKIAQFQLEKAKAERAAMKTNYLPSLSGSATGIYLHKNIEMDLYMPTVVPNPATGELVPNVMTNPTTGDPIVGADGNPIFNMYAWLPLEISFKGAYMAGISLEQPIYTGGKIAAGNAMTQIGIGMATDNLDLQQAKIIYETDQAYWLYVSVQEKVKLAELYNKLLKQLEERVQLTYKTGMITQNDFLKVVVKHNEAKLQLQKARNGLELTRMALCRQIGLPLETSIVTTDSVTLQNSTAIFTDQIADVSNRAEYKLMQKNVDLAQQQVKLSRANFLPTAGVSVGYNYIGGIEFSNTDYSSSNASVIASVKIPLFHWGEGRQKQLSAQLDQSMKQHEMDKNTTLIKLEMEQARLNVQDAQTRVLLAQESLKQADENLRVHTDNYELGMAILTDLLESQAQWQQVYSEVIEAKADLKLKETAWLKATGNLNESIFE
jgi:outer membrane protein TolC